MLNVLGEHGIAHVEIILDTQGRLRYLEDWEKDLTQYLSTTRLLPGEEPIIDRFSAREHAVVPYRLRVTHYPASEGRRFQYDKLKAAHSLLYHQNVTVLAPDAARTFTFPKAAGLNELRSAGWQAAYTQYADRRGATAVGNPLRAASELSRLRDTKRELEAAEKAARIALSKLSVERDALMRAYTFRGEVVRVRSASVKRHIDLTQAERSAELRPFITRYPRQPYTKVWFQRITEDEGL